MKTIFAALFFLVSIPLAVTAEIPKLDYHKLYKEHGNKYFSDWPKWDLPYTEKNQKMISELITLCFQDIRHHLTIGYPEMSKFALDGVVFGTGYSEPDDSLWYLCFGGGRTISDFGVIYVYSPKEKKLVGRFFTNGD